MAKSRKPTGRVKPVNAKKVYADVCPKSPTHGNTRVTGQRGRTRYCICDDCGHTWKQIADEDPEETADVGPLVDYVTALADALDDAPRDKTGDDQPVIVLADEFVRETAGKLRELAGAVT